MKVCSEPVPRTQLTTFASALRFPGFKFTTFPVCRPTVRPKRQLGRSPFCGSYSTREVQTATQRSEVGRSVERMLQAIAKDNSRQGEFNCQLEQQLQSNLAHIKTARIIGRSKRPLAQVLQHTVLTGFALCFTLGSFVWSVATLGNPASSVVQLAFATVLLAYSKVLSFLLHHECCHENVFNNRKLDNICGGMLDVLNGAQYWDFEELKQQHLEHHRDKVDYIAFDHANFLRSLSKPLSKAIVMLEMIYFPVMHYVAHWRSVFAAFHHPQRLHTAPRTAMVIVFRTAAYIGLGMQSFPGLLLYFLSHNLFVNAYRLLDCFSHTFEELPVGAPAPKGLTAAYEQNRTVNLLCTRTRRGPSILLNALFLNFGYHGAHHVDPSGLWTTYPELDQRLFQNCPEMARHVAITDLMVHFHAKRIDRLYNTTGMGFPQVDALGQLQTTRLFGVLDPSILQLEIPDAA